MALARITRLTASVLAMSTVVAFTSSVPAQAKSRPHAAAPSSAAPVPKAAPLPTAAPADSAKDYASIVLADHPTVYYRLGDSGRAAIDSSGYGVDGTFPDTTTVGVTGAIPGDPDQAIRAATRDIVLQAPAASLAAGNAARTVEFWFKAAGASGTTPVLTYGGTTIFLRDTDAVAINDSNRQSRSYTMPYRTDDDSWHLWDVAYDGANATFYLDGQSLGTQNMPIDTGTGGNLRLGGWAGDYDELAVYPTALDAHRINARWTRGESAAAACAGTPASGYAATILEDRPSVYYRLGDRSAVPGSRLALDSSGNCRNAAVAAYTTGSLGPVEDALTAPDTRTDLAASAGALPSGDAPRTVEFWFKAAGASGATPVLTYGGTTVYLRDTDAVAINDNNRQSRSYTLPYRTDDSTWHLWNVAYDGVNATFYLDGQSLGTQNMPIDTGAGGSLWLGGWAGAFDELAVYPTALTPARIAAHWTGGAASAGACVTAPTTAYAKAVLADKPDGYYRLGDLAGSRVAYDFSGHCRNAAAASFARSATGAIAGDDDGALRAPDRRTMLTASAAAFPSGSAARTVEFWFRGSGASGSVPVLTYGGTTIYLRDTDAVAVNDNNRQARSFELPARTDDDVWHLWDVTYDGADVSFYLDGASLGTQAMPISTGEGGGLWLGGWAGDYDELAVYPSALSPARIGVHWTRGNSAAADACAGASASAYGKVVGADEPALYYRLGDLATENGSRVAFDNSGNCANAAYGSYVVRSATGAVAGDQNVAVHAPDRRPVLRAPAASLPTGAGARTLEFWFRADGASGTTPVLTYGGTTVYLRDTDAVAFNDNNRQSRSYALPYRTDDKLWHLWDVTYDGTNATFYLDGDTLGTQPIAIDTGKGGSLQLGGWAGDYDELAVYPAALTGDRVRVHYQAGLLGDNAAITGTVTFGDAPVAGALVQGCTAVGACVEGRTNRVGAYVLSVTAGAYDLTVFPPAAGNGATARVGSAHAVVPDRTARVKADVALIVAALPAGSTIESPTVGTQTSGVPTIYWAEPTVYRTSGCPNGIGQMSVIMPNGSERDFVMPESPLGSGKYTVIIPPLSPLHGDARIGTSILCRISATPFVPGGGPEAGGNNILVHVDSATPAASFTFGGKTAPSFTTDAPGVYLVRVPAGTGDVSVAMAFADGTSRTLDTYHYLAATPVTDGGPANGGNQITLTGKGFTDQTMVLFGTRPAANVTVESSTRLHVTVPSGSGSVPITIVAGGGVAPGGTWNYEGDPTEPSEGVECDDCPSYTKTLLAMWADIAEAKKLSGKHFRPDAKLVLGSTDVLAELAGELVPYALGLNEEQRAAVGLAGNSVALVSLLSSMAGYTPLVLGAPEILLLVTVLALGMYAYNHSDAFKNFVDDIWHMLIDPSGTIVDRNGTPVPGATVTLLRQGEDGTYTAVPADSEMIDPHTNPQVTPSSGAFAWMAAAGSYRVRATSPDCVDPATGTGATVEDGPYVLPPPALGLLLTLPCTLATAHAPAVTGVSPSTIAAAGGDTVTIYGADLAGATGVKFGVKAATSFKVLSPYSITAVAPAGSGEVAVRVTTAGGSAAGTVGYLPTRAVTVDTTTTVTTAPTAPVFGSAVTVKAIVAAASGTAQPTGTVTVSEGTAQLGTGILTDGTATVSLDGLAVGRHTITVSYTGAGEFQPSSGTVNFTVSVAPPGNPAATTTTLTVAPGAQVTLSARTTSAAGTPDGVTRFLDGDRSLGTAPLVAGTATLAVKLSVGTHKLKAKYGGSMTFAASSAAVAYKVSPPSPSIAVSAAAAQVAAGRLTTVRATAAHLPAKARKLRIVETSGRLVRVVAICSRLDVCTATVRHDPGAWRYQAQALDRSQRVLLASSTVVVTWRAPTLTVHASSTSAVRGQKVTLHATTDASTSGTPYLFVIRDLTAGRVVGYCGAALVCTVAVTSGKGQYRYEAAIRTGRDATIARSPLVMVTWR